MPLSATQGVVTSEQPDLRPVLRAGELLEVVPGLIVTQHTGDGKANKYFLRGFNLDHGTDLGTSVDGLPVNMPTRAHGQGYTDINFVIPELVQSVQLPGEEAPVEDIHFHPVEPRTVRLTLTASF